MGCLAFQPALRPSLGGTFLKASTPDRHMVIVHPPPLFLVHVSIHKVESMKVFHVPVDGAKKQPRGREEAKCHGNGPKGAFVSTHAPLPFSPLYVYLFCLPSSTEPKAAGGGGGGGRRRPIQVWTSPSPVLCPFWHSSCFASLLTVPCQFWLFEW